MAAGSDGSVFQKSTQEKRMLSMPRNEACAGLVLQGLGFMSAFQRGLHVPKPLRVCAANCSEPPKKSLRSLKRKLGQLVDADFWHWQRGIEGPLGESKTGRRRWKRVRGEEGAVAGLGFRIWVWSGNMR